MADQSLKVIKDFKYGTRMMRAREDVVMTAPHARLYTALGAVGPRDADGSGKVLSNGAVFASPTVTKVVEPKAAPKRKPAAKRAKKATAKKAK